VLSNAADRQMLHVRSFQTGPRSVECQRLLNELSAARNCLLDSAKKSSYDQSLAASSHGARRPIPVATAAVSAPNGYTIPAPIPETGVVAAPSRKRRSGGLQRSPLMLGVQVVSGGIAGVALAWAVLWYGFGADPLGLMPDPAPPEPLAELAPQNEEERRSAQADSTNDANPPAASPNNAEDDASPAAGAAATPTASSSTSSSPPVASKTQPVDVDALMELDGGTNSSSTSTPPKTPPRNLSDLTQPPKSQKHAQPTTEQIREATADLKDALGDDLAPGSSREERLERLTRLKKLADDVAGEPHVLWVVLREAYLEAGNLRLYDDALQIVDRTVDAFAVDEVAVRSKMLKDFAQVARQPADRNQIATAALTLAEQAHEEEKFQAASELAALAEGQAAKAGNAPLRTQARQRDAEYTRALRAKQGHEKSMAALDADPDDAGAHAIVGRYVALLRGDFERAIPHLAKSDDARLQPVAQRDAAGAATPEDQMALADAWFDLAASDSELAPLYARARHWYQLAEQGASGLVAVRIHSRQDEIDQAEKSGAFVDRSRKSPAQAKSIPSQATREAPNRGIPIGGKTSPPRGPTMPLPPFAPGTPFFGSAPPGVAPPMAYDRVNQLAPTAWRAVLPQSDSRQVIQHPSISIKNEAGVVTVAKERSQELESIHLINEIPMLPEFTARLRVRFPKANSNGGGTRVPFLGLRSMDGRSQTYVHVESSAEGVIHEIVLTRRGGVVNVAWNGQAKRVHDDTNLAPAQIFFHLNDDAALVIQSLVIEP
jgi:tetratricopeptide (TPR) repeat protein